MATLAIQGTTVYSQNLYDGYLFIFNDGGVDVYDESTLSSYSSCVDTTVLGGSINAYGMNVATSAGVYYSTFPPSGTFSLSLRFSTATTPAISSDNVNGISMYQNKILITHDAGAEYFDGTNMYSYSDSSGCTLPNLGPTYASMKLGTEDCFWICETSRLTSNWTRSRGACIRKNVDFSEDFYSDPTARYSNSINANCAIFWEQGRFGIERTSNSNATGTEDCTIRIDSQAPANADFEYYVSMYPENFNNINTEGMQLYLGNYWLGVQSNGTAYVSSTGYASTANNLGISTSTSNVTFANITGPIIGHIKKTVSGANATFFAEIWDSVNGWRTTAANLACHPAGSIYGGWLRAFPRAGSLPSFKAGWANYVVNYGVTDVDWSTTANTSEARLNIVSTNGNDTVCVDANEFFMAHSNGITIWDGANFSNLTTELGDDRSITYLATSEGSNSASGTIAFLTATRLAIYDIANSTFAANASLTANTVVQLTDPNYIAYG